MTAHQEILKDFCNPTKEDAPKVGTAICGTHLSGCFFYAFPSVANYTG
jgi:hypothetical protein